MALNFVITGLQSWDLNFGSNAHNIARELAKHHRVLYVNLPTDTNSVLSGSSDNNEPGLSQVAPNLWVYRPSEMLNSINWVPVHSLHKILLRRNANILADIFIDAIRQVGFDEYTLINDNDLIRTYHLADDLKPNRYIFYLRDYLMEVPYWARHGKYYEGLHLAKADAVMANSVFLADYASRANNNSIYIGQGCDFDILQSEPENEIKLPYSPEIKTIGYLGLLTSLRLDIDLIAHLSEQFPYCKILLVGPEDEDFSKSILHQLPNVVFTGPVPPTSTGAYIRKFDVAINPQKLNMTTMGNYPRKVDEYLYLERPTVATATPAMIPFAEHVGLADNYNKFALLVEKALNQPYEKNLAGKQFAQAHTWQASVQHMVNFAQKSVKDKSYAHAI